MRAKIAVAPLFFVVALPAGAEAAAFATARFGGEHGNPTESNPTALYYNPAGIAWSEGKHLFVDGSLALRSATWEHAESKNDIAEPKGTEGANYGKATLFNVFAGPSAGATMKVGDLAFGVGLFVPFGGRASWDKNEKFANHATYPYLVDGVQRWHGIEGALTFIYLTAGAAYKLGPLSIGVSGNFILSSIKTKQAKSQSPGLNEIDAEARAEVDVKGKQGSFGVGLMYEAMPDKLWMGASYQSQPGLGEMKLKGTLTLSTPSGSRPDDVDFYQHLPDVVRAGVRFRPSKTLELRLFGDLTRWSRMVAQCITLADLPCTINADGSAPKEAGTATYLYRGWKDSAGVRAGASTWMNPEIELFAGLGFETAAVPDETLDPNLLDANTVFASLGGRFEVMPKLFVGASYSHLQYLPRDTTGKSVLANPTVVAPTRRPDGGGKYTSWVGILNVSVEKQF